ncbi:hypothetical protein BKA62DRAFT_788756 [Auriculariales sp. MPI-PUGE-AT-0066]|nr:hypothetical protein BKA62DRAFT_788756 [Auriculariales sp. MPI-PUGE-AT-0066]
MWSTCLTASVLSLATVVLAQLAPITVDDVDPGIVYVPENAWYHESVLANRSYWGNTISWTRVGGAYFSWTFTGTSVEYWLRHKSRVWCVRARVGRRAAWHGQGHSDDKGLAKMLWSETGLAPDVPHTIKVTVPADGLSSCGLDHFVYVPVDDASGMGTSSTASASSSKGTTTSSSSSSTGGRGLGTSDIIALVVGLGIGIPSLVIPIYFGLKSRSKYIPINDKASDP